MHSSRVLRGIWTQLPNNYPPLTRLGRLQFSVGIWFLSFGWHSTFSTGLTLYTKPLQHDLWIWKQVSYNLHTLVSIVWSFGSFGQRIQRSSNWIGCSVWERTKLQSELAADQSGERISFEIIQANTSVQWYCHAHIQATEAKARSLVVKPRWIQRSHWQWPGAE